MSDEYSSQKTCYECANDYTVGKPAADTDRNNENDWWNVSPEREIHAQKHGFCSYACKDKAHKRNRAAQLREANRRIKSES